MASAIETTVGELLSAARKRLAAAFQPPGREAALLLGHLLDLGEAQLWARSREPVSGELAAAFEGLLVRRLRGEPVAHLLGEREFYGRPFRVDRRVLIPRPETEHLIEAALRLELPERPRILDLGTGSGAIALTLALELPAARVVASDLSLAALQVFGANRRHLAAADSTAPENRVAPVDEALEDRVAPPENRVAPVVPAFAGDLAAAVDLGRIDLLVSNPPYVDSTADLSPEVRDYEPAQALFPPGGDGRAILRHLLRQCLRLRPGARALFEIGYDQGAWIREEITSRAGLELVELVRDLAGHERIAHLRRI